MSNEERKDIEDKINRAMAQIVSDTVGEAQSGKNSGESGGQRSARPLKSARPKKITYVPIDESEFEPVVHMQGCRITTPIIFLRERRSME